MGAEALGKAMGVQRGSRPEVVWAPDSLGGRRLFSPGVGAWTGSLPVHRSGALKAVLPGGAGLRANLRASAAPVDAADLHAGASSAARSSWASGASDWAWAAALGCGVMPSPATHAISTLLEAGENVGSDVFICKNSMYMPFEGHSHCFTHFFLRQNTVWDTLRPRLQ